MISHHGVAGSDDPDESPDAAADDACSMFLDQDYRHHPGTVWQNSKGREIARRIYGGDPGAEMLPRFAPIDMQIIESVYIHLGSGISRESYRAMFEGIEKLGRAQDVETQR